MADDKYIVKRRVGDYVRYICPVCGMTLMISDESRHVEPPKMCGRCGEEVFEMEDEKD